MGNAITNGASRTGCGLNVSFNSEQYGSEERLRGDRPMAAVSEEA